MAKRSGYSTLDYILGGLAGGLRGYGEDKERRKLEADKAEERRLAQEEREYRRSQDALRNTLALYESGYEPDVSHRQLPQGTPEGGIPEWASDMRSVRRPVDEASKNVVEVGGRQFTRTRSPEIERQMARFQGREDESLKREQAGRDDYEAGRIAGFGGPFSEEYNPALAGSYGAAYNRLLKQEQDQRELQARIRTSGGSGGGNEVAASVMNSVVQTVIRGKVTKDLAGRETITPYEPEEIQELIDNAINVISQLQGREPPARQPPPDLGEPAWRAPFRYPAPDSSGPSQPTSPVSQDLSRQMEERYERSRASGAGGGVTEPAAMPSARGEGDLTVAEMKAMLDSLRAQMDTAPTSARRREIFRMIQDLEAKVMAADVASVRNQFGAYRSRGGGL
jgi:hypothetical protein